MKKVKNIELLIFIYIDKDKISLDKKKNLWDYNIELILNILQCKSTHLNSLTQPLTIFLNSSNKPSLEIMKKSKAPLKFLRLILSTNLQSQLWLTFLSTQQNLDTDKWQLYFLKETSSICMEISLPKNKNSSEIFFYLNTLNKPIFSSKKVLLHSSVFFSQLCK